MPSGWKIRARVNAELGFDIYAASAAAWRRARTADPDVVLESWFRTPEEHFRLREAAALSQHLVGLGVDVKPSTPARRAALIEAARREGFTVIPRPSHLHLQALDASDPLFQRLVPLLRSLGVSRAGLGARR